MARFASAILVLALASAPALAFLKIAAPPGIASRAAAADLVIVGKVTAIEKEEVEVAQYPNSPQKVSYKVAVVQVEDTLTGKTNETHIKIGFQPTGIVRGGLANFDFKENAEGVFFLRKHAAGGFYAYDYSTQPLDAKAETYKADLATVKKAVAVFADPMKSLKAKEGKDAYFAAAVLVAKYRTAPSGSTVRSEAVPTDVSKLILQTLLEADWSSSDKDVPSPYQTLMKLGMTQNEGWKPAAFNGNGDFNAHMKDEFKKWHDGDGAKFQVKKYVVK